MAWPKNSIGKFGVMRKCLIIIGIVLGLGLVAEAQMQQKATESKAIAIGIKGGVNIPRMYYFRNRPLSQLPQNVAFTSMGGLFVDIPLGEASTVSPEFVYLKRGTDLSYEHRSGMMVHYTMSVHYVDFRLPFEFRLPVKPYFQPYLVAGAEVGMRLGGQIHMDRTAPAALDQTINVGDANMGLIHAGAFAGVGIRSRIPLGSRDLILKFSASVHQGLLDTYSKAEKEGSVPAQNVNAYQTKGFRLPQGLEVCLGIALPLERIDDACSTFSGDRYRRKSSRGRLFGF